MSSFCSFSCRWLKEEDNGIVSPILIREGESIVQKEGSLIVNHVQVSQSGKYVCEVNNSVGEERSKINLVVTLELSVHVQPQKLEVDVGKSVSFNCSIHGSPVNSIVWLKDRRIIFSDIFGSLLAGHQSSSHDGNRIRLLQPTMLNIRSVVREDAGMYQCIVNNDFESAQGTAELKLGDIAPVILSTFEESTVEPGIFVSLRCVSTGNPLPSLSWYLDDAQVPNLARFRLGDFVTSNGQVVSFVNITNIRIVDGGEWKCIASNDVGQAVYVGRLNVLGPPSARLNFNNNITVVAGRSVIFRCPVVGFPIDFLKWEHNGHTLPINHRQKIDPFTSRGFGGKLRLENVQRPTDEGEYSCSVKGFNGGTAKGSIYVTVKVSPLIDGQPLPEKIYANEGMRVKLVCSIIQGDSPVEIKWYKEGIALISTRFVSLQNSEDYSLLTFKKVAYSDKGNYTCEASNEVETVNRTTDLIVNVPPKWKIEPNNVFIVLGHKVFIDCSADGYPQPRISWKKAMGSTNREDRDKKSYGNPSDFKDILSSYRHQIYSNGSLIIQEVDKTDMGYYMCQVSNGIAAGLSKVVLLTVHSK